MQAIRRLYLYAVALVSLETLLWGLISLARSLVNGSQIGGASQLAGALALILVGIPVFGLHWWLAQRGATQDSEERAARLRAVFLYTVLLATLVPVVQNFIALAARLLLMAFDLNVQFAVLGGQQSASDNLIAMGVNALAAVFMASILRADWRVLWPGQGEPMPPLANAGREVRRLYRYLWLIYGLGLVVLGLRLVVLYILTAPVTLGSGTQVTLANSLALLIAGVPVWLIGEATIRRSLAQEAEREALLRLGVLYLLVFAGIAGALVSAGLALYGVLRILLGASFTPAGFLVQVSNPLSAALPFGLVWATYARSLSAEINLGAGSGLPAWLVRGPWSRWLRVARPGRNFPAASQAPTIPTTRRTRPEPDLPRRAGLRRLYFYVLALFGLAATFLGVWQVLGYIIQRLLVIGGLSSGALRDQLAGGLALLVTGLPVWLLTWEPMASEAAREDEWGDHSRRSIIRRAYLFLALFAGVVGAMFSAGVLLYQLLRALLGAPPADLLGNSLLDLKNLLLLSLLGLYHGLALRSDTRRAARSLVRRHAQFPVLVLAMGTVNGSAGQTGAPAEEYMDPFAANLVAALKRTAPDIQVAVHPLSRGAPDGVLAAARAVILPAEALVRPEEALRLWLQAYSGFKLVIPAAAGEWLWVAGSGRPLQALARQAAQMVRRLAEGEEPPVEGDHSTWETVVHVLAGLFLLEIVLVILSVSLSIIFGG